jgi:hypothetical protein
MAERIRREKFPKTIAAVRRYKSAHSDADRLQWVIGDALIAEVGPPGKPGVRNGSKDKLANVAIELRKAGFEYSVEHLRDLRATAARFTAGDRSPSVEWTMHAVAGSPETLNKAMAEAKRLGRTLTVDFVKRFVEHKRTREKGNAEDFDDQTALEAMVKCGALAEMARRYWQHPGVEIIEDAIAGINAAVEMIESFPMPYAEAAE